MRTYIGFAIALGTAQGCTDWRDTQNPDVYVLSYTALAPFPDDAQPNALANSDPDLAGEGCKRVLTTREAQAFNALLQVGMPVAAIETSQGPLEAKDVTLSDTYTVVVRAPDSSFAGIISLTATRDFDGNLFEIKPADYFSIEFAAIEYLAAKGCGDSYEDEVARGLVIPEWAKSNRH